jgi:hypothetical protein
MAKKTVKYLKCKDTEDLKKLRKLVREYLHVTEWVPMRAIDCDQDLEERLWDKLAKASNFRYRG